MFSGDKKFILILITLIKKKKKKIAFVYEKKYITLKFETILILLKITCTKLN